MKHLRSYKLFENNQQKSILIDDILEEIVSNDGSRDFMVRYDAYKTIDNRFKNIYQNSNDEFIEQRRVRKWAMSLL